VIEAGVIEVLALLFGLIIGSFLNVCIYRWPRDLSVVRPRSHCIACEKTIAWYDNIPLLSYLILRGRCRHCGARISWRYPFVELLTGLLFFYFVARMGPTLTALKMCVFAAMLVALAFSDLEQRILPDEFTLGGTAIGLLFAWFVPVPDSIVQALFWLAGLPVAGRAHSLAEAAFGAVLPAFFLWFAGWLYQRVRRREGLGQGDIKLIAMVGSFLGLSGALLTLAAGSLAGSIIGYSYIRLTRKDPHNYELPLGTFLAAAALAIALVAQRVLNWYGGL
jgi:leader peptidase (prepilin peptidase) / N-methyltransferase